MLKKPIKLKENDGYIIDSLGWAYYAKKNYDGSRNIFRTSGRTITIEDPIN